MLAMLAFIVCLICMSPASLCEKNSIGSLSTFHMYEALPTAAILPFIFSEYMVCAHSTISCSTANAIRIEMNGISQSGFRPLRSLSMNTFDVTELTMPKR